MVWCAADQVGGALCAELTHQCLGSREDRGHVKSVTLRQFPELEMSFHCLQ